MILIPRSSLPELARGIARFVEEPQHPKINFFLYVVPSLIKQTILEPGEQEQDAQDKLVLHVYDACGESHGRLAFGWALDIPGAVDWTRVTDMRGIVNMQREWISHLDSFSHDECVLG